MNKDKKLIVKILLVVSAILIISSIIYLVVQKSNQVEEISIEEDTGESRLLAIRDRMVKDENYYIQLKLNEDNKMIINRKGKQIKVVTWEQGVAKSYIVKDNTTYLLSDKTKKVYEYKNSTSLLNDFVNKLNDALARK